MCINLWHEPVIVDLYGQLHQFEEMVLYNVKEMSTDKPLYPYILLLTPYDIFHDKDNTNMHSLW